MPATDPRLAAVVARQPYPLLFVTISGAHLYGFPSADSDYDLRGVHVLPLREVIGLDTGPETIEESRNADGLDVDLVTHDVQKFLLLMLKRNGYVLEQLLSPLVVSTTPTHVELKSLAPGCITRHHAHHYLGFAETQWHLFTKESTPRIKPLLYTYRVLLTGINLMRTGQIEADLRNLNAEIHLNHINDLLAAKLSGAEQSVLPAADLSFHEREYRRLREELESAAVTTHLPDAPTKCQALHELLIAVRLAQH